jgi:hypothetical protein
MIKLGEKVTSIEFSDTEKKRLADALRLPGSLQTKVVRKKALQISDHRFWKSAQKQFSVTGFRDGHPSARDTVVKRAFEALKTAQEPFRTPIWSLYRTCVSSYVIEDLTTLNRLLQDEPFEESAGSLTLQVFKGIRRGLPIYGASVADAESLYDLWGFPRDPAVPELLSDNSIDGDTVKRLIVAVVQESKREITGELATLVRRFEALTHDRNESIDSVRQELQLIASKFGERLAEIQLNLERKPLQSEERRTSARPAEGETLAGRRKADVLQILTTAQSYTEVQIEDLAKRIKQQDARITSLQKGPPHKAASKRPGPRPFNTLSQLLTNYAEELESIGFRVSNPASLWTITQVLRGQRIIVTDKEPLVSKLYSCIPNSAIRAVAVSPLWVTAAHWAEHFSFISEREAAPRLLVLLDFDVSIQEAFVLPELLRWLSNIGHGSQNKVVLVPSVSDLSQVSSRILEIGVTLISTNPLFQELQKIATVPTALKSEMNNSGNPQDFFKYSPKFNLELEAHIRNIGQNCGIQLPSRLVENFIGLQFHLTQDLPEDLSGRIAANLTLMPWMLMTKGESLSRIFRSSLSTMFGGD